ncbi:MAG: cupredoxin domain-containing protein [Nitrososphaera sp.]
MAAALAAPVLVGLAAGVALIVVFSMTFQGTEPLRVPEHEKYVVRITLGASMADQNITFEPEKTRASLDYDENCCGVIKWVNNDTVPAPLQADDDSDPAFYRATQNLLIEPGAAVEFTFTKPGEYGFHGRAWQHGLVDILPCLCD